MGQQAGADGNRGRSVYFECGCAGNISDSACTTRLQLFPVDSRAVDIVANPCARTLPYNTPGAAPIRAPVLIVQGTDDPTIPPEAVRALGRELCARGDVVEYRQYSGVGHEPIARALPDIFAWAQARVFGAPPPSSCGDATLR